MSYIVRNNVKYATGGSGGGNLNIVKLTQAEYDALPDSKNSDGILYAIEDGEISSSGGSAKAITISQEDFDKLSEEEKANGIYVIPDGEDLTAKNLFYDGSETGLGNTVQNAIDNVNKNFEWKLVGSAVGRSYISLPNNFNELFVDLCFDENGESFMGCVIPEIAITETELVRLLPGGYWNASGRWATISISKSNVKLCDFRSNTKDKSSECTLLVYYR